MAAPIINPWIFYFAGLADSVKEGLVIGAVLGGTGFLVCGLLYILFAGECYGSDDPDLIRIKKAMRVLVIITVVCAGLQAVLPSESTIMKMLVARYANGETVQAIKEAVNYIIEAMNSVK